MPSIHPEDTWPLPGKQLDVTCSRSSPTTVARLDHLSRRNRNCQWLAIFACSLSYRSSGTDQAATNFTHEFIGETLIIWIDRLTIWTLWLMNSILKTKREFVQFLCTYRSERNSFDVAIPYFFLSLPLFPIFFTQSFVSISRYRKYK